MRLNIRPPLPSTHEGAPAVRLTAEQKLRRSVLACLLFEDTFYEDGVTIAERIRTLAGEVKPETVAALAIEARGTYKLRHAPLWLAVALARTARGNPVVRQTVEAVAQRADELAEVVAMYWEDGRKPLPAQLKRGLAAAFAKFDEYQLAKYARNDAGRKVKLRDVLRIVHPRPADEAQAALWGRLRRQELAVADTHESAMAADTSGENAGQAKTDAEKRAVWERLLREGRLGYLALLKNLRNMLEAEVDEALIRAAIRARKGAGRVLPFRFVQAARAAPRLEGVLDEAMLAAIADLPALSGKAAVLVDVSSSMDWPLAGFQRGRAPAEGLQLTRLDAAATLASMLNGEVRVFTFSEHVVEVAARKGMAGVETIRASQPHHGTRLFEAIEELNRRVPYDRLIVLTDEQAHASPIGKMPAPQGRGYVINVAAYQNGVGYGAWVHIDGFSEAVLRFVAEYEAQVELTASTVH
ncbi:MAG: TROVE domain-containing protein [Bauldia sp.]|nr:TROVE domain-containing protein [Bauldia sp.]